MRTRMPKYPEGERMLGAYAYKCPFFTGDQQARDGSTFWVRCEGGSCVRLPTRADAAAYVREYCASYDWQRCSIAAALVERYKKEERNE